MIHQVSLILLIEALVTGVVLLGSLVERGGAVLALDGLVLRIQSGLPLRIVCFRQLLWVQRDNMDHAIPVVAEPLIAWYAPLRVSSVAEHELILSLLPMHSFRISCWFLCMILR